MVSKLFEKNSQKLLIGIFFYRLAISKNKISMVRAASKKLMLENRWQQVTWFPWLFSLLHSLFILFWIFVFSAFIIITTHYICILKIIFVLFFPLHRVSWMFLPICTFRSNNHIRRINRYNAFTWIIANNQRTHTILTQKKWSHEFCRFSWCDASTFESGKFTGWSGRCI